MQSTCFGERTMKKRNFKFVDSQVPHEYKGLKLIGGISRIQKSDILEEVSDEFFGVDVDGNIVPIDGSWWGKQAVLYHLENKQMLTGDQVLEFLGYEPPKEKEVVETELDGKFKKEFYEFRTAFMDRHKSEIEELRNLLQYDDSHYIHLSRWDGDDNNVSWFLNVFID
jgi:hypothetical protein